MQDERVANNTIRYIMETENTIVEVTTEKIDVEQLSQKNEKR